MDNKIKIYLEGMDKLDDNQKQLVNKLLNEYSKKIQRQLKNFITLSFDLREYEKSGKEKKAKKFSVYIKISGTKNFEANYADWDLARTVHKTLNKIMNEIEKEFHSSDQHDKTRKFQNIRKREN